MQYIYELLFRLLFHINALSYLAIWETANDRSLVRA